MGRVAYGLGSGVKCLGGTGGYFGVCRGVEFRFLFCVCVYMET